MRILTDIDALPVFRAPVVTVGSFDGVHRGHRFLLEVLRHRAAVVGGETVVVTFDRHPRSVLHADEKLMLLTSLEEKANLLAEAGVDNLVVMPFNEGTAAMSPEEFVSDFLVGRLGTHELVVGYNHRFGRGREGDADLLDRLGEKYGFGIFRAPQFSGEGDGSEKISSTTIREALSYGNIEAAERMLGHKLRIEN